MIEPTQLDAVRGASRRFSQAYYRYDGENRRPKQRRNAPIA